MTREATYHAARAVATTVEKHFARHLAEAQQRGERELAHAPNAQAIEKIIDATFWASFRPEEGRFPKISLAFLPPEQAGQPLMFENRLPLTATTLTKLAPAAERPYRTWGYPFVPVISILLAGLLIVDLAWLAPATSGIGILIVLTGVPIYFIWRRAAST